MSLSLIERAVRWLWPPALAGRISRLLAIGVMLLMTLSLFALRQVSLHSGSEQIADLVAAQIASVRVQSDGRLRPPLGADGRSLLDLHVQDAPPASANLPWLPFGRRLIERLQHRLGPERVLLVDEQADRTWLWVGGDLPNGQWLGLALPPFRQQATLLSLAVALVAALLVMVGGVLLANLLTRPLKQLAASAPAMVAGEMSDRHAFQSAPLEVQQLAESLNQAGFAAREQARRRELMLAGLSHDLRTPLARLRYALAIEPLRDPALAAQVEDDLEEIDALVGLFLDLGRGQALRAARETIELAEFLSAWLPRVSEQDWRLELEPGLQVRAPSLALRRLLGNLIQNAEHHAAPPFVLRALSENGRPLIELIDAGPGIAEHQRAALLQPFVRGHTLAPGNGLGLAIANALARLLDAGLSLHAAEPRGLRVRLIWREPGPTRPA